jgi:hypothetical protein
VFLLPLYIYHHHHHYHHHHQPQTIAKIAQVFPKAVPNGELVSMASKSLASYGYDANKSLVATSFCCDEVNRTLEADLFKQFGMATFSMGGLAGFAFGGITSFGAMAAHIPDGGSCLVVYGPHVGVSSDGSVGTVERRHKASGGACCGSAVAASMYVQSVFDGGEVAELSKTFTADSQQAFVGHLLLPHAARLAAAGDDKMAELPYALYDAQDDLMQEIIAAASGAVGDGHVALLGGIQINTPAGLDDYFLPLRFDVRNGSNEVLNAFL